MSSTRKTERNRRFLKDMEPLYYDYLDGVTGKLDEDGIPLTNASQGLSGGLTWVQLDGQREGAAVLNGVVNPNSPGVPVQTAIDRRTGKRQVVGANWEEAVRIFGVDGARRVVTTTPTVFESDALLIGKVEPAADLNVYVRRFVHDNTEFTGAYEDLSAIVAGMTASTQEMVIVGVDPDTNTVVVTEGVERSLAYAFTQADADAINLAAGVIPLAGLVLRADQTESADSFVPYTRQFDRRHFLSSGDLDDLYVALQPEDANRNTIVPTGGFQGLGVNVTFPDPSGAPNAVTIDATQTQTANNANRVLGISVDAELNNATFNNTNANGVGAFIMTVSATGTAGTVTALLGASVSGSAANGVTVTKLTGLRVFAFTTSAGGVITSAIGMEARDQTAGGTNNVNLWLGSSGAASPVGSWNLYGQSTKASALAGSLSLGGTHTPSFVLSLSGEAAQTVGMEREATANNAGRNLTLISGGATSGATNKAAGALVLQTGINTGNSVPALIQLQAGAVSPTSATTDNAIVDRLIVGATKVLTDNSAITIVNATHAAGTVIGGIIRYLIEVTDGTDYQGETGFVVYTAVNKAGAFTTTINEVNSQQAVSAGTLATTWAISGANPEAISVNANSSLTPSTGFPRITYTLENFSQQAVAIA